MKIRTVLVAVVLLVLAAGAFADGMSSTNELFFQAVRRGDLTYVKNELDSGRVSIDILNSDGWSPLMVAVDAGRLPMVTLLLKYNPDMSVTDPNGIDVYKLTSDKGQAGITQAIESHR